jgi:hypothetical protein
MLRQELGIAGICSWTNSSPSSISAVSTVTGNFLGPLQKHREVLSCIYHHRSHVYTHANEWHGSPQHAIITWKMGDWEERDRAAGAGSVVPE